MIPDSVRTILDKSKESKNQDDSIRLINLEIMNTVGGYEQFMNLPLSAYVELFKAVVVKKKSEMKMHESMLGMFGGR